MPDGVRDGPQPIRSRMRWPRHFPGEVCTCLAPLLSSICRGVAHEAIWNLASSDGVDRLGERITALGPIKVGVDASLRYAAHRMERAGADAHCRALPDKLRAAAKRGDRRPGGCTTATPARAANRGRRARRGLRRFRKQHRVCDRRRYGRRPDRAQPGAAGADTARVRQQRAERRHHQHAGDRALPRTAHRHGIHQRADAELSAACAQSDDAGG